MIAREKVINNFETLPANDSPKKSTIGKNSASLFPDVAPPLRKDQLPAKVDISNDLWNSIYATLRDYPDGLDQANLTIRYIKNANRPLGGSHVYDKCHVKSIPELLVSIPYVGVKELAPNVVGFHLIPVPDWSSPPSVTTKYRAMERIMSKSTLRHQQAKKIPPPKCRDFESDDENDSPDFMRLNFQLPPQPAHLVKAGARMPESLRYSIYYLLAKDYTDGVDVVKFNQYYQQHYKQPINPGQRCQLSLHEVFTTMQDLVHFTFDGKNVNSMRVWPKTKQEILGSVEKKSEKIPEIASENHNGVTSSVGLQQEKTTVPLNSSNLQYSIGPMNDLTILTDDELIEELYKVLLPFKNGKMVDEIPSLIESHGDVKLINFLKKHNLADLFREYSYFFETLCNDDDVMFVRSID